MHKFIEQVRRLRIQRRKARDEERRQANLAYNSNCIGTTADLFRKQPSRIFTGDSLITDLTNKKSSLH